MPSLEQQMAERRARILEAARGLIESRGYEQLTMRDLARASAVTVPTIYNLIGGKQAVLLAAVEEQTRGFAGALERAHGDPVEVVEAAVRQLVRRPRYYRSLLLVLARSGPDAAARRHVLHALEEQLGRALGELDARGELAGWVDVPAFADRLRAHLDDTALEWARGALGNAAFRAVALLDAAALLLGVSSGASRERFERVARAHRSAARRPQRARGRAA